MDHSQLTDDDFVPVGARMAYKTHSACEEGEKLRIMWLKAKSLPARIYRTNYYNIPASAGTDVGSDEATQPRDYYELHSTRDAMALVDIRVIPIGEYRHSHISDDQVVAKIDENIARVEKIDREYDEKVLRSYWGWESKHRPRNPKDCLTESEAKRLAAQYSGTAYQMFPPNA